MAYCFIISSNSDFVNSAEKFVVEHTYHKPLKVLIRKDFYVNAIEAFKYLSEEFSAISFSDLRETIVLLDEFFHIHKCDVTELQVNNEVFWGRMILAFPEIEFLFLNRIFTDSRTVMDWLENESKSFKNIPFIHLFDFNGLRENLRQNCNKDLQNRTEIARVIEDEISYAFFHAYIAYKCKYRSKLYTTLNHLNQDKELNPRVNLQIQDLSLGFIDKSNDKHLLGLPERLKEYPFLKSIPKERNFLITIENKPELSFDIGQIQKPTKGIFDIIKQLNLTNTIVRNDDIEYNDGGHSAPGILAMIADNLIDRAQQILDNAKHVKDAIHAAVLSLEAKELLNRLTPTLALQAFTLQQKAEVTAECLFVGTEYNIDLKPRFKEIEKEVEYISKRFAKEEQQRVQLNTQLIISEILSGVFSSYKQFEEELECLNRARKLNFKLKEKGKGKIYARTLFYLSWAMNRVRNFALFLLILQLFFAFFYYLFMKDYEQTWIWDFSWNGVSTEFCIMAKSFLSSVKYFFTTETSESFIDVFKKHEFLSNVTRGFQGFCSLSSLSIFMAMVYLRISRK